MTGLPASGTGAAAAGAGPAVVIDTNIALDLLLFDDPAALPLREALDARRLQWLATPAMREELARVLGYEPLRRRLVATARAAGAVLGSFDGLARIVEAPLRARAICRDPDDQKFVDLAVARECLLLSKDRDLLSMKKRLAVLRVPTAAVLTAHNDPSLHLGSPR
jgi:putative PIN family toxin of toxin-antitoxin system